MVVPIKRGGVKGNSLSDAFAFNNTFAVLAINLGLALVEVVKSVKLGGNAKDETHSPAAVGVLAEVLGRFPLADADGIGNSQGIKGEIASISELTTDGGVAEERVHALGVSDSGSGLEMLDILAETQDLAGKTELLLDGVPRRHLGGRAICAQEIPGVETGEILKRAEELIAADGGGDEAQVVGHRRVIDEGVCDHDGRWVVVVMMWLMLCFSIGEAAQRNVRQAEAVLGGAKRRARCCDKVCDAYV